jgi:hypothetical protein
MLAEIQACAGCRQSLHTQTVPADAINPTYTYGRRQTDESAIPGMAANMMRKGNSSGRGGSSSRVANGDATAPGRTVSGGRTMSGRPAHAGVHHGFKGDLLFKSLPGEEVTA